MKTQLCSILFLLPLALTACVDGDGLNDLDCEKDRCDGLGDFDDVAIALTDTVHYACADTVFDPRCENAETHADPLYFPKPISNTIANIWFTTTATVELPDDTMSSIAIQVDDNRLLAPSERTVKISDVASGINGFSSRGGLQLEYRIDGDVDWNSLGQPNGYWGDVEVVPETGIAQGTLWYCEGNFCEDQEETISFTPVQAGQIVEYRLTLIPIWNIGEFDTGEYSIRFDLD